MNRTIVCAFAALALSAAVSAAEARNDKLAANGTLLTGIALGGVSTGTVSTVILPSGETVDLR